jgi:hypothetical protein
MAINDSQMQMLEEELENLHERVDAKRADVDDIDCLQVMTIRMLQAAHHGPYEAQLIEIRDLLETMTETQLRQKRALDAFDYLQSVHDQLGLD